MNIEEKLKSAKKIYNISPKCLIVNGDSWYLDIDFGSRIEVYYATVNYGDIVNIYYNSLLSYDFGWDDDIEYNINEIIFKLKLKYKFSILNDKTLFDTLGLNKLPKIIYNSISDKYFYFYIFCNGKYNISIFIKYFATKETVSEQNLEKEVGLSLIYSVYHRKGKYFNDIQNKILLNIEKNDNIKIII